jgi:hypothetical protein
MMRHMVHEISTAILGPLPLTQHPKSKPFTPLFSCVAQTNRHNGRVSRHIPLKQVHEPAEIHPRCHGRCAALSVVGGSVSMNEQPPFGSMPTPSHSGSLPPQAGAFGAPPATPSQSPAQASTYGQSVGFGQPVSQRPRVNYAPPAAAKGKSGGALIALGVGIIAFSGFSLINAEQHGGFIWIGGFFVGISLIARGWRRRG